MCKVFFFLLRSVGRGDLSAGPEQKKNSTQGVFFFCSGPGERQGKEKPRWKPARGQSKKKHHPGCFFFAAAPAKGKGRRSPVGSRHGARAKKPGCFFFAPAPGKGRGRRSPVGRRHGARAKSLFFFCSGPVPAPNGASSSPAFPRGRSKKKHPGWCFFFCSGPVPASNGASPSLAFRRGRSKKKNTLGGVFFFLLWPRAGFQRGFSFPCLSPGPQQKKNTLGGVFFFAAAPRGRSLTHCGPGWRCLPLAGAVFFFLLRPRPDRGGVFFLLWPRPDAHSLTVGWGDFGKARVVFFLLRPRRVFLDNSKKCLGYYIGSKKTRRGHSFPCLSPGPEQKKHTLGGVFFFALAPCRLPTGLLLPLPFAGAAAKKTPWVVLRPRADAFFCSGPVPASNGASPSPAFPWGRSKKKTTLGGVFFCSGPVPAPIGASPSLAFRRGRSKKKKKPGWCFFFALAPCRHGASPSPAFPRGRSKKKKKHPGW